MGDLLAAIIRPPLDPIKVIFLVPPAVLLLLSLICALYSLALFLLVDMDKGLPTVPGRHFLLGHMHLIGKTDQFANRLAEWSKSLKVPAFTFYLPGFSRRYVTLTSLEAIAEVHRLRPFKVVRAQAVLGDIAPGLFAAEGGTWRSERKIISPAFNHSNVSSFLPAVRATALRLSAQLRRAGPGPVPINAVCKRFAADVTAMAAFGEDFGSIEKESRETEDLAAALAIVFYRQHAGPFKYWKVPIFRDLLSHYRWEKDTLDRLDVLVGGIVDDFQKDPTRAKRAGTILSKMVELNTTEGEEGRMSRRRLIGNVITLFVAGTDTTSITITWMIYFISLDADLQDRLRAEAFAFDFEALQSGGERMDAVLRNLPVMHAVVLETLRTRGPVGQIAFMASEKVRAVGREWEPNTKFMCLYDYAMTEGEDAEKVFGPNPGKFDVERWLGPEDRMKKASKLLSFGNGARICPGRDLAKIEAVVAVSTMLKEFKSLRLEPGHAKVERVQQATIAPSTDIRVIFED